MAGFRFKFVNGRGVAGVRTPIEREAAWSKRTDNDNHLRLPLETKAFEGLRATTAQGLAERGWSAALTGQAATTAQGTLGTQKRYYEYVDNFVNSNGTGITSHSSDAPQYFGYAAYNYTTEPTIESNRLRGPGAADTARIWCVPYWTPTVKAENDFWLEVSLYRRNSTAGATSGIVNTGVLVRGSGTNGDGFVIGWNELDDDWYILEYIGGTLNQTLGQGFGNGAFTGTSQERKLLIHVYTFTDSDPYYNVHIDVFVDSGSGYNTYADFYGTAYGTLFGGTAYYEIGQVFEEVNGVDVEWVRLYDDLPQLEGARLTATPGTVVDFTRQLTGYTATTTAGSVSIGGGTDVEVALTGEDATTAQGTITPDTPAFGVLTGYAATTTQGALTPAVTVLCDPTVLFSPRVAWTYYNATVTYKQNPGNIGTQFLPWQGVLYGAGNDANEQFTSRWPRSGLKQISQITEETWPWTANPAWTSTDNTGMSIDDPLDPNLTGKFFPRGFAGSADPGYKYNTVYSRGGWLTINQHGNIWSAVERIYDKMGQVVIYLAPHQGEVSGTNYYNGPELLVGSVQSQLTTDPLRQRYQTAAPMGLYALSDTEAIAFYPQIIDGQISGKFADLVGLRATTEAGTVGKTYTPGTNLDIPLTGHAATTAAGIVGVQDSATVPLTGLEVAATQGVLYARDANVVPAFRRLKGGAWSDTPVVASSFTGAARVWARSHYLTVVPSGYGDTIFAVYYSEGWGNTGPKIGVLVMDASTGEIVSNTLYSVASTVFSRFTDGTYEGDFASRQTLDLVNRPWGQHRTVALTHKLGSGTHVTQFLFCGQVVHLSWTSGTRTAPTVTIKDGVALSAQTAAVAGWESLEIRGDKVYHVVPVVTLDFGEFGDYDDAAAPLALHYNDATGTSSTWTAPTVSTSTSGTKATSRDYPSFYGGYGGGRKSHWYAAWFSIGLTERGHDTGWFDAWYQQPKPVTLEARALLGRVGTTVSYDPNVTLTGRSATTAQGTLYADVTYQRQLTGLAATTAQGAITPEGGDVIAALTGLAATTDYGDLTVGAPPTLVELDGLRATTGYGWVTFSGYKLAGLQLSTYIGVIGVTTDETVALTGLQLSTAYGTLTTAATASLTGEDATSAAGVVTPAVIMPHWKFGLAASLAQGALTPLVENAAALAGAAIAAIQGALAASNDHPRALTGQAATTTGGAVTPSQLNTQGVTGQAATARAGSLVPLVSVSLSGEPAVSSQGTLQLLLDIFLTGRSCTTTGGELSPLETAVVPLTGARARAQRGQVMEGVPYPYGQDLWVTQRDLDAGYQEADVEEVVTRTPADN